MIEKRKTIRLELALLGITVFSGQASPPTGKDVLPAPIQGPPGTDAIGTTGNGVFVDNALVSLGANFTNGLQWKPALRDGPLFSQMAPLWTTI